MRYCVLGSVGKDMQLSSSYFRSMRLFEASWQGQLVEIFQLGDPLIPGRQEVLGKKIVPAKALVVIILFPTQKMSLKESNLQRHWTRHTERVVNGTINTENSTSRELPARLMIPQLETISLDIPSQTKGRMKRRLGCPPILEQVPVQTGGMLLVPCGQWR